MSESNLLATEGREQQIRERLKAATPGPWIVREMHPSCDIIAGDGKVPVGVATDTCGAGCIDSDADAALIANAPADLQFLLDEVSRLRSDLRELEQLRGAVWALADTLARRCLDDANKSREAPNDWPAGQQWNQLVGTSHSIMRGRAYAEALLDRRTMISLLCDQSGEPKRYQTPTYPQSAVPQALTTPSSSLDDHHGH